MRGSVRSSPSGLDYLVWIIDNPQWIIELDNLAGRSVSNLDQKVNKLDYQHRLLLA